MKRLKHRYPNLFVCLFSKSFDSIYPLLQILNAPLIPVSSFFADVQSVQKKGDFFGRLFPLSG